MPFLETKGIVCIRECMREIKVAESGTQVLGAEETRGGKLQ